MGIPFAKDAVLCEGTYKQYPLPAHRWTADASCVVLHQCWQFSPWPSSCSNTSASLAVADPSLRCRGEKHAASHLRLTLTLLRFRCFSCYSTPIPRRQIVFPEYSDAALGPAAPPACSGVECSSGLHKWLWLPTGLDGEVAPDTLAPAPAISPFSKQSALRCQPLLPLMFRRAALGRP